MPDRWVISVEDHLNYEIVDIVLKEPIEPKDIVPIGDDIEEKRKKRPVLILSGRAPTWLYGYLSQVTGRSGSIFTHQSMEGWRDNIPRNEGVMRHGREVPYSGIRIRE